MPERALIIAPHASYRTAAFMAAARALGMDVLVAAPGEHSIVAAYASGLHIDLSDTQGALARIGDDIRRAGPYRVVVGTDDASVELAAHVSALLGLPHNDPAAARLSRRKDLARARLAAAGAAVPLHRVLELDRPLATQLEGLDFPCVVKPVHLSGSRGVIRVDNPDGLRAALARVTAILRDSPPGGGRRRLLVEEFIPGPEYAVEGMLRDGVLQELATFDKPDPLDGPYFEETYYITPARLDQAVHRRLLDGVQEACAAYGLREGPVHAECRVNDRGVWIVEVAARTIGGLCGRLLTLATGCSLEELVIAHGQGRAAPEPDRRQAAGVLMIPVPAAGILRRVEGLGRAERVPLVEEVVIQVREGYELVPLPEGSGYLGFIFARGDDPDAVEAALRRAHGELNIVVAPLWQPSITV